MESFVAACVVMHTSTETAALFGELKDELRRAGTPIPENDIWIAATCIENDVSVVTRDKHFARLRGRVNVMQW